MMRIQNLKIIFGAGIAITLFFTVFLGILLGEERTEIRIGVVNPISGKESSIGKEIRWAYELAAADINEKGGVFVKAFNKKLPVTLIIADDESDSAVAAEVTEKLIVKEKVDLILGTHPSFKIISSCWIAEKHQKYYHAATCIIPKWRENKFQYATNFFTDPDQSAAVPFEILNRIPLKERPKKIALLMEDTPDGEFFGLFFKRQAKAYGYDFLIDAVLPKTRNYLPLLMEMKKQEIDALFVFGDSTDLITLIKGIKQIRLPLKYLHGWKGAWPIEFSKALGDDAQLVICDGFWSEEYPYPRAKRLGTLFHETFGKHSVSVGLFYGSCQVLFQAIEDAGTLAPEAIRNAIANHEFKGTVLGDIRYDKSGVAVIPGTAHQWWNGKQEWIYPFHETAWQPKIMPPWDQK